MITLLYLHGFRSSPASVKARELAGAVAALPEGEQPALHVPMQHTAPAANVAALAAWIERNVESPRATLTIVGSSLGGFYATHLAERFGTRAVVVNPAIRPYDDLKAYAGAQTNMYTGNVFVVTSAHFDELRALAVHRITRPERYLLLAQSGDDVLDWREAVAFYGGAFQHLESGGDHAFVGFARHIPAVLRFAGVAAHALERLQWARPRTEPIR